MTRDEIIRDLEERAVGEDCRYIALRCDVARKIVRMLKEQEPRVLEYSEIEKHPLVWLEYEDKEDVIPGLFLQYDGGEAEFSVQDPIVRAATVIAFEKTYNVMWRAWTSRPSPEQMRDTPWGGEQ